MSTLLLVFGIAFLLSFVPLAFMMLRAYARLRGPRVVVCPETITPEAVEIGAVRAAWTAGISDARYRLTSCSRWPERGDCPQECLSQIEAAPDGCLVRERVARWYAGASCALCGEAIEEIRWFHRSPGLIGADGRVREWRNLTLEDLPDAFATGRPLCFDCCVAEEFRSEFPDLVVDAPHVPALGTRGSHSWVT